MKDQEFLGRRFPIFGLPIAIWIAAAAWLSDSPNIHGAVVEAWVQRHSSGLGNAYEFARKLVTDGAGDVIIAGESDDGLRGDDIVLLKYSGADGTLIWQQRHDGPGHGFDGVGGLALDSSSNVVMAGGSVGLGTGGDFYTAKYAAADGALLWERRFNGAGNYNDFAAAVAVDREGNVLVAGMSYSGANYDYYTAKYAGANGALLWEKSYNGPANRDDELKAMAVDPAGNVIVMGGSDGILGGSSGNFHMIKYAATDGTVLWERIGDGYVAMRMSIDRNGDVVVTGPTDLGIAPDFVTAKYRGANGALLWSRRYDGSSYDQPHALALDANGNVIVTGQSFSREGGGFDYYTAKYAAGTGEPLWERRFDGPAGSDWAYQVAVDARGDVFVTGESWGNETRADAHTLKYSGADGTTLWENRYHRPPAGYDVPLAMGVDPQGNVFVTGGSSVLGPGFSDAFDMFTIKYASANGATLWQQRYNGPYEIYDAANAAAIDPAGNVIVTGTSAGAVYTIKYDESGATIWTHRYNGSGTNGGFGWGQDAGKAVAVDGNGNVAVTGSSLGLEANSDFYTAKYRSTDGALLWERRYEGPIGSYDEGSVLATDAEGNVIVAGQSYSSPEGGEAEPDFYTAKYAASDGSLLWERRYDGGAGSGDWVSGMKLDPNGNVVVTGSSTSRERNLDAYTAKYAAANGALLWEHRYNGPANYIDHASAVAIDAAGNVIVTGASGSGEPQYDYDLYTAKYAAADGRLLWEVRYSGPGNLNDEGFGVAVDAQGNPVITGYSHGPDGRQEIYTAKYRSTDGALLWEQSYSGPAPGENVGTSIAVDEAGNAVLSGYSFNGVNPDYYTAKYAAADGSLLWERRYNGPLMGLDYPGARGLAVGPNGMIAITGVSDRDFATVVYQDVVVPSARDVLAEVLAGLKAMRPTVNDRNAGQKLDRSIAHLTDALDARLWRDENRLNPELGESVFRDSQKAIEILCALLGATPNLPNALLNTFIERVVRANRLLAATAIEDAMGAGIPASKVEQARRFLARGDATAETSPCGKAIEDYRNAWKSLNRANVTF
jgi:uncharacterized delta-60 repeat protein